MHSQGQHHGFWPERLEEWSCHFTEMGKTTGRVGLRGKYQGLSFEVDNFEAPVFRHSTGDVK